VINGTATLIVPELENEIGRNASRIGELVLSFYAGCPTLLKGSNETVYRTDDGLGQFDIGGGSESVGTKSSGPLTGGWSDLNWKQFMMVRESKTVDPDDGQHSLQEFRSATQVEVNPDAVEVDDERIEDLPAFVDADRVGALSKFHPDSGGKFECDHCGANHPWGAPLERGVRGGRPGGIEEGNPDYEHCDPGEVDIKKCDCCGCPRCASKSLRFRSGTEDFACNQCSLEFEYPVSIDGHEDATREKLLWECEFCGEATRAPFTGIPVDLLD